MPSQKKEHLKRWFDSVELFFIREIIVYQSFPTCWRANECGIALFRISSVLHVMWCLMLTLKTQQTAEEEANGPFGWPAGRYRTKPVRFVTRWYSFWLLSLLPPWILWFSTAGRCWLLESFHKSLLCGRKFGVFQCRGYYFLFGSVFTYKKQ